MRNAGARTIRRLLTYAIALGAPAVFSPAMAAPLPSGVFSKTAQALVRIDADRCSSGGGRQSQGFLVAPGRVLTVRHGIAGCADITVTFYGGADKAVVQKIRSAKVGKVLAAADLAQLDLDQPVTDIAPLAISPKRPDPNAVIYAIARWVGASGVRDKEMRVANGSGKLGTIVNDKVRRALETSGSPSLDLEIVNLDVGIIVHGTSGAPIVDAAGTVVAIADGGLDDGFAGINWAVPTSEVARLLVSKEQIPTAKEGLVVAAHFSSQLESSSPGTTLTCNGVLLARVGSRTFDDLLEASDDPAGLRFVAGANAARGVSSRFDVYVNVGSGAALAVPAGAKFAPRGDHCVAVSDGGNLTLDLRIFRTPGTPSLEMERAALQYEAELLTPPLGWMPVPAFTYPTAISRPDGLVVRRKNLWRFDAMANMWSGDSYFATFAARGDLLLAYSVAYRPGLVSAQLAMRCNANPFMQGCDQLLVDQERWGRAAIAVHATTFARTNLRVAASPPPGANARNDISF